MRIPGSCADCARAGAGKGQAQILDEPEARIHLADEQQAAVAGDLAALEGNPDFSALEAVKMEVGWGPLLALAGFLMGLRVTQTTIAVCL